MILFLDPGAFLKLYVAEAGSGAVRRAVRSASGVYALDRTYLEVRAALAAAARLGLLRAKAVDQIRTDFDRDWEGVGAIAPDPAMLRRGADLAEAHALGASVALDVAAGEALYRQVGRAGSFRYAAGGMPAPEVLATLGIPELVLGAEATDPAS